MKKLINSLLKMFGVKLVEVQKEVKATVQDERAITISEHDEVATKERATISKEVKLTEEEINKQVEDISTAIIALGYKAIPDILRANSIHAVEKWCMFQAIQAGVWSKEEDNLEGMNIDELIEYAQEMNQLNYERRMIEQGKAGISEQQMKLFRDTLARCKKLDKDYTIKEPTNKFEASRAIEEMFTFTNKNKVMIGNITEGQYKKLKFQCKTLGIDYEQPSSVKEASTLIQKLDEEIKNKGIDTTIYATEKQIEHMHRLYKQLGKRWTKKSAEKWAKLSISEMSTAIAEKKKEVASSPALDSRIKYVKSLANKLNAPLPEGCTFTNQEVNALVAKFKKKILNNLASMGEIAMTSEDIDKLDTKTISELITQISVERKSKHFEKNAEECE